jgi:hypothetical protein
VEAANPLLFRQDPAGPHPGFQTFLIPAEEQKNNALQIRVVDQDLNSFGSTFKQAFVPS